jgi:hypothetical protein
MARNYKAEAQAILRRRGFSSRGNEVDRMVARGDQRGVLKKKYDEADEIMWRDEMRKIKERQEQRLEVVDQAG